MFPGNNDEDSLVTHMLECPFIARFVRLLPQSWTNHIALRFDVIGCQAVTGISSLFSLYSIHTYIHTYIQLCGCAWVSAGCTGGAIRVKSSGFSCLLCIYTQQTVVPKIASRGCILYIVLTEDSAALFVIFSIVRTSCYCIKSCAKGL